MITYIRRGCQAHIFRLEGEKIENAVPFMKIKDACRVTGLSQYFLRNGCKDGSIPCVKSGTVYLINIPALLRKLDAESVKK